jgi:hypothetical protein
MRAHSHRSPSVLAGTLVALFFVVSFNAYACLVPMYGVAAVSMGPVNGVTAVSMGPVNGVTAVSMGIGCSTPDEQPVSQQCDAFKTLGVQPANEFHVNSDSQTICSEDTASLALLGIHTSPSSRLSDHPTVAPPQDLLLKISVLRI